MSLLRGAVATIGLFCAACTPPITPTRQTIEFEPNTGAIVELDIIQQAACGQLPRLPAETWTPDSEIVPGLEAALLATPAPELERIAERFPSAELTPADYYRRYAGVVFGERQIIVNCGEARWWYDRDGADWRTQTIPYRDGGAMSFSAYYDPATDETSDFAFGYLG